MNFLRPWIEKNMALHAPLPNHYLNTDSTTQTLTIKKKVTQQDPCINVSMLFDWVPKRFSVHMADLLSV